MKLLMGHVYSYYNLNFALLFHLHYTLYSLRARTEPVKTSPSGHYLQIGETSIYMVRWE